MFVQLTKDFLGRRAGERIDVSPADAQQLVAAGSATTIADDPISGAVGRALEGALSRHAQTLDAAVNQALKSIADAQGQARRHAVPALFGNGDGDPRRCFGDWCLAVARDDRGYLEKHYGSRFNESAHQGGARRGVGRHRRLHGAAGVLPAAHDHHGGGDGHSAACLRAADGRGDAANPLPRHHHGAIGRRQPVLRRRADVLDRRGPDRAPRPSRSSSRWS